MINNYRIFQYVIIKCNLSCTVESNLINDKKAVILVIIFYGFQKLICSFIGKVCFLAHKNQNELLDNSFFWQSIYREGNNEEKDDDEKEEKLFFNV